MIVIGSHVDEKKGLVTIGELDLQYHTAVIGQSGSGKSYYISRLVEEIILRTRARVLIIDPNGDFTNFYLPQPSKFWSTPRLSAEFSRLDEFERKFASSFETETSFSYEWMRRRFQFISPNVTERVRIRSNVNVDPLKIHWKNLYNEQDFYLGIDPRTNPKLYQGYITCIHYIDEIVQRAYPHGYSIEDLEEVANNFASKRIAVGTFPTTSTTLSAGVILSESDWVAVRLMLRDLRKRFNKVWHEGPLKGDKRPLPDLTDYIKNGFGKHPWQTCVVELTGLQLNQMLFAANTALDQISKACVRRWASVKKKEAEVFQSNVLHSESSTSSAKNPDQNGNVDKIDDRVPTFVVIDEAHNFAPDEPINALQKHVSDKIATIAAEGRNMGCLSCWRRNVRRSFEVDYSLNVRMHRFSEFSRRPKELAPPKPSEFRRRPSTESAPLPRGLH